MDQDKNLVPMAEADMVAALRESGLIGADDNIQLVPLTGGVSCDVWRVESDMGPLVVKRPLPQLRVKAEWLAPVSRGTSEMRWLRRVAAIDAALVPEIVAEFPALHGFAMHFIPDSSVWKDALMAGHVDANFAAAMGQALGRIHAATAFDAEVERDFPNEALFTALRIDPFLLEVARRNPDLAPILHPMADLLAKARIALIHGDVSPKNILMRGDQPIILDAECATYGDPAFDLAFCTAHFLLKAIWSGRDDMKACTSAMVRAYAAQVDWEAPEALLNRAGGLCAALLMARVDGKSPAPYLTNVAQQNAVRTQARRALPQNLSLYQLIENWAVTA
jgi:aminoglycoside phosphotransferase (APT) family kinase protein